MAARLGNVIYWIGVVFAWMCALAAFSGASRGGGSVPILIGLAVVSYLVGWAARYVLSGNTSP